MQLTNRALSYSGGDAQVGFAKHKTRGEPGPDGRLIGGRESYPSQSLQLFYLCTELTLSRRLPRPAHAHFPRRRVRAQHVRNPALARPLLSRHVRLGARRSRTSRHEGGYACAGRADALRRARAARYPRSATRLQLHGANDDAGRYAGAVRVAADAAGYAAHGSGYDGVATAASPGDDGDAASHAARNAGPTASCDDGPATADAAGHADAPSNDWSASASPPSNDRHATANAAGTPAPSNDGHAGPRTANAANAADDDRRAGASINATRLRAAARSTAAVHRSSTDCRPTVISSHSTDATTDASTSASTATDAATHTGAVCA